MSRVYFTATFQHKNLPIPTFSFETNDHTGGGYEIGGLHPSSIAALIGKPPDVKPGERFDLKFNLNKQRTSLSLVVFTTKHLPHVEWSSDGGMGKCHDDIETEQVLKEACSPFLSPGRLPLAGMGALATQFLKGNKPNRTGGPSTSKKGSSSHTTRRHDNRRTGDYRKPRSTVIPPARQIEDARRESKSEKSHYRRGASSSVGSSRDDASSARQRRRRKDDWDYDSGYASDEASSGRGRKGSSSPRKEGDASRRRGRSSRGRSGS